ncbi:MAG: V-type ATP synthase subunit E family protein [Candidatus Ancaeobacter aquaticus]|nr:V-type ATP synthase subunit E family protein [Candidatus Ancaeobacter aquaticus]
MALTDITEKIISDANIKAQEITKNAEADVAKIQADARGESSAIRDEILQKAEREILKHKKSARISSDITMRNEILKEKQAVIQDVFVMAKKLLVELPKDTYCQFMKNVLTKAIVTGDEEVLVSSHEKKRLDGAFIASLNDALFPSGKKGDLTIGVDESIDYGCILRGKGIRIDCTLETLLILIRTEAQEKLVAILFGGEK